MAAPQSELISGDRAARKGSVGQIELTDDKGRRRTVQLDELTAADRELAEKFGYKPVSQKRIFNPLDAPELTSPCTGLQA